MNGNAMYEVARQRIAERQLIADQRRAAAQAGEAHSRRAAARGRHARNAAQEPSVAPVIPDYADELLESARDTVPAPRQGDNRGRHAQAGR
jgi:hypothetical protein